MKCRLQVTEQVQKELNARAQLANLILLILGSIGLLAYIVIGVIHEYAWLDYLLWVSAIFFGFGLVFYITIKKINKKNPNLNSTVEYELNEDHFVETIFKNNEQIGNNKFYYKNIMKIRDMKSYIFIYVSASAACAIPKSELTTEEITTLKTWIEKAKQKL